MQRFLLKAVYWFKARNSFPKSSHLIPVVHGLFRNKFYAVLAAPGPFWPNNPLVGGPQAVYSETNIIIAQLLCTWFGLVNLTHCRHQSSSLH